MPPFAVALDISESQVTCCCLLHPGAWCAFLALALALVNERGSIPALLLGWVGVGFNALTAGLALQTWPAMAPLFIVQVIYFVLAAVAVVVTVRKPPPRSSSQPPSQQVVALDPPRAGHSD